MILKKIVQLQMFDDILESKSKPLGLNDEFSANVITRTVVQEG